jgi:hypothetical protein
MKVKLLACLTLAVAMLLATVPTFAHHGGAAYDNVKVVELAGTVTSFQFINPHCIILLDVKAPSGEIQHWTMETPAPSLMKRSGWYKDMMKPGDQIAAGLHIARNGSLVGKIAGNAITVNGTKIVAPSEEQ